jgi:histidine triad (HIT) family protein
MDCIFCKIVARQIPATIVYEDDEIIAFNDSSPQAPIHVLVIPKKHIATLNDTVHDDEILLGRLFRRAVQSAKQLGIDNAGYRIIANCNFQGGQTVCHIHLHLLGGRTLQWPPG